MHSDPDFLRRELQAAIDEVPCGYDRIILLYGVCGKGIVGLNSGNKTLLIPRVHDCISLFLGGTAEYRKQFSHKPGTYYISPGWYDEQVQPKGKVSQKGTSLLKEHKTGFPRQYVDTMDQEVWQERFGQDNTKEITGFFDSWKKNYTRAVYIDTGSARSDKYEKYARALAEENGWEYTELKGSTAMIRRCFDENPEGDDLLIVPPGRKVTFDPASSSLSSATPEGEDTLFRDRIIRTTGEGDESLKTRYTRGLGIDAGGTYTDAVLYDFKKSAVLSRAKALTTKWKYSEGIMAALEHIPAEELSSVDLVSLSTTLVTNAIVESNTHPVGLLIMPPGRLTAGDIEHVPASVIQGRMTIEGAMVEDIDPEEIRQRAEEMITHYGVRAFAVSGYGGSVNPRLELKVKKIIRESTGLDVCCGHELSGSLNFYIRARTAVLNAGTIPIMEEFLREMKAALDGIGVKAPILVVRGDGSIMTESYASDFPVQTALSGPAASMAGARHLTDQKEALVADVGGTTTDIGFLEEGLVSICDDGAAIGRWKTHVRAVDMLTVGLGGDSEILFDRQSWRIGPRRITPFCWLDSRNNLEEALGKALKKPERWEGSFKPLQWFCLSGKKADFELTGQEKRILDALAERPMMAWELGDLICDGVWKLLRTERLEKSYCLLRIGLTPTDLYHREGALSLWDSPLLKEYVSLSAIVSSMAEDLFLEHLKEKISRQAGGALLDRIFPGNSQREQERLLEKGNRWMQLQPRLNVPVIGLGGPAGLMLKDAVTRLGGELIIPENSEVANAVGAVTSEVSVSTSASIVTTAQGLFRIQGIAHEADDFESLEETESYCLKILNEKILKKARAAGTSSTGVEILIQNRTAEASGGESLFLERQFSASLTGIPDLV